MDKRTYDALLASIDHWQRNADDPQNANYYADTNPLCRLFYLPPGVKIPADEDYCVGCPVSAATGSPKCRNTPFPDARHLIDAYRRAGCMRRDVVRACRSHVKLLRSLLPADDQD